MNLEKYTFGNLSSPWQRSSETRIPSQKTVLKSRIKEVARRNIECRDYLGCLDSAARKNVRDLGCGKCPNKDNKSNPITGIEADSGSIF